MTQNFPKHATLTGLRVLSVLFIFVIVALYVCVFFRTYFKLDMLRTLTVTNGQADLTGYRLNNDAPVQLDGQWEYYAGHIATANNLRDTTLWRMKAFAQLPATNIMAADLFGTYRMLLTVDDFSNHDYVLYFPHLRSPIELFVNGVRCEPCILPQGWSNDSPLLTTYRIGSFDATRDAQEIVITVNFHPGDTALFKRSAILGSPDSIWSYMYLNHSFELFTFGALSLISISAFIFMFFLPDHRLMTLITIFDTLLTLRVTFGLSSVMLLFERLFGFTFSDTAQLKFQLFLLLATGISGAMLSQYLFDPQHRIPRRLTGALPIAYAVLAVLFTLRLDWFDLVGVPLTLGLFLLTFLIVLFQFVVYLKTNRDPYAIFQVCKTAFVGGIIFLDILCLKSAMSFLPLCALYLLFFMLHVTTRQYDSNVNYKNTQAMNTTLELLVNERTHELEESNRTLEELSIRDPLTKIFNRLYLEQTLERAIIAADATSNVFHCCMFDLDFFKNINDTYGHDVGDEQLIAAVRLVSAYIDDDCVLTRVGGEEFVIVFYRHSDSQVIETVQKMRLVLEDAARNNPRRTTASFGIVRFETGTRMKDLLKRVDLALYRAKNNGRNCVEADF